MSKASDFAAFNFRGTGAVASVADDGQLVLRIPTPQSFSHEAVRLTFRTDVAVAFARWILDTFGETP